MNTKKIDRNYIKFLTIQFLKHGIINNFITIFFSYTGNILVSYEVVLKINTEVKNHTVIVIKRHTQVYFDNK